MTTRRIIFPMPSGVGFWISPMLIGDKTELLETAAPCSCDLDWPELQAMFQGVHTLSAFEVACTVAQLTFTSSDGAHSSEPPAFHLSLDDIRCDELYCIVHGEVKQMHGVNPQRIQIHYWEQEQSTTDTFEFDCGPGTTAAEVLQAIEQAQQELPMCEDEDRFDHMEEVLTVAAAKLHATWEQLRIIDCLEVT